MAATAAATTVVAKGSIYIATCKSTGKSYIGQTQDFKERGGRPYRYGVQGRWSDHISSSYAGAKTPFAEAICEYGPDDFEVRTLESDIPESSLDEREAHWIKESNTCVPNGYNVMRHARCKHREMTTLATHYLPTTIGVRITLVKRKGAYRLVHLYLDQDEEAEPVRLVFGQGESATFEEALLEAQEFAGHFAERGVPVSEEVVDDPLRKYREKIELLRATPVQRIRIAKFNALVALYITHAAGTTRICFGGKTVTIQDAYATAIAVKNAITEIHAHAIVQDDMSESATGGRL